MDVGRKPFAPAEDLETWVTETVGLRARGKTWRWIAQHQGYGYSTIMRWFEDNPEIKSRLDKAHDKELIENLLQTGTELAIDQKNDKLLIYYTKAKLKMFDQPDQIKLEVSQAVTPEQAKELLMQRVALVKKEA